MSEAGKELPIYPPVMDYLRKKHQTLKKDYRTEDGKYSEHCGLIAIDIAELLLQGGERPSLKSVRGDEVRESGFVHNRSLVPKIYEGRVSWGGHTICAVGDTIFDPMVGEPMNAEDYRREVFTEPVNLEDQVPEEFMKEFIQRRKPK